MTGTTLARGAISTSHHLATEAGAAVIEAGGNAVDAAITAAATLCVVYPNNVALGGDLVALVRRPDGHVAFLNATGTAPAAQSLDDLRSRHGSSLPLRGIDTVTVPGGVRGWDELHRYGATRPWSEHFDAAINHAAAGFPNSRSVAAALVEDRESLSKDPGARDVFYPEGEPVPEGDILKQPALGKTLSRIASFGADEFYTGETAQTWISGLGKLGSKISLEDTAGYTAIWGEPLEAVFGEHRVLTGPPNTSGFMLLRALDAISSGIEDPLASGAGALSRVFWESNCVRASWLADPTQGGATGSDLIAMEAPSFPMPGDPKATGDTVGFSVATSDGWAVSLINSVYWGFGAHILEPSTGVIFQNRGTSFSLDPASPNAFSPAKRPRHTLMPVLVFKGDQLEWVPATMGGAAQPQIHAQLLLRALSGSSPASALSAPRWMVNEWSGEGPVSVTIEENASEEAKNAIRKAGFALKVVPRHSEDLGHSNLIHLEDGNYSASSDPRSDGSAIVVPAQTRNAGSNG